MAYIVILEYKLTVSYKTEQLYHMIHQLSSWYLPKGVENLYTHTHTHTHIQIAEECLQQLYS